MAGNTERERKKRCKESRSGKATFLINSKGPAFISLASEA